MSGLTRRIFFHDTVPLALAALCLLVPAAILPAVEVPPEVVPGAALAPLDAAWATVRAQVAALGENMDAVDEFGKPRVEQGYKQAFQRCLGRLDRALDERNLAAATQACEEMLGYPAAAGFRKGVKDVSTSFASLARSEQTNTLNQARIMIASLPAACARAASIEELQALFERVQQMQNTLSQLSSRSENPAGYLLRNSLGSAQQGVQEWMNCTAAMTAGDEGKALESLNRLQSMGLPGEWANAPEVARRSEQLQAAVNRRIEAAVTNVCEALLKAATGRAVQALAADFNRQYDRLRRVAGNDSLACESLDGLRNLLGSWRRVVLSEEKGDFVSALQNLANMDNEGAMRMDARIQAAVAAKREALLKRLVEQPVRPNDPVIRMVDAQMAAADTLEKLVRLRAQLAPLQNAASYSGYASMRYSNPYGPSEVAALLADLQALESMQAALQARQYTLLVQGAYSPGGYSAHRWRAVITRHMNTLRSTAFSVMYGLSGMDITEGQPVAEALLLAADKAFAGSQWDRLGRCLEAYRAAAYGMQPPPAALADQINACRSFVAAGNYERVGDVDRAVTSYLAVLQAPAERSPLEAAVAALARLRKENPDAFARTRSLPVGAPPAVPPAAAPAAPRAVMPPPRAMMPMDVP
ncbi:MAG: hypothetical protein WCI17_04455 [bacterium]